MSAGRIITAHYSTLARLEGVALSVCLAACADAGPAPAGGPSSAAELGRTHSALSLETAPETLGFTLDIDGQPFRMTLERAAPPLASNYHSYRQRSDGSLVALPVSSDDCSYRGRVEPMGLADAGDSGFAAVNVCTRVTGQPLGRAAAGVVRARGRFWRLTPDVADADAADGIEHWLQPLHRADAPGAAAEVASHAVLRRTLESTAPRLEFREGTPEETKYIDLIVVNDAARVARLGRRTEAEGIAFVETMNAVLANSGIQPRLRVTLRAQVQFDTDPYNVALSGGEVNYETLLDNFLGWGNGADLPAHDEHLLLSGLNFLASTVGYAGLEVACNPRANGFIVQADAAIGDFAVLSAVHELGHTIGMSHDDGVTCSDSDFIMAAVGCVNCQRDDQFSPCSIQQFGEYLDGPAYAEGGNCADDVPTASTPLCGDGAVSAGETCDCGSSDCSDLDPCCDGASCQLVTGAACSDFNDGCCQSCQVVGAQPKVVCRAQKSDCDIAEVCSGLSKDCPTDDFESAGGDCIDDRGNTGSCYFGDCRSRGSQCTQIAEQQGYTGVGAPDARCGSDCNRVVCGNGPNGCVIIEGPGVVDGVACNGGQCIDGACVRAVDQCPHDVDKTEPGSCGCGVADKDTDADGVPDCVDTCPRDVNKQAPGACGCGSADTDADSDGTPDCNDACPTDPDKQAAGQCGCGELDSDSDSDGTADCNDACPADPRSTEVGPCGCGVAAVDTDRDGIPDCNDACPADATRSETPCARGNGDGSDDLSTASFNAASHGGCAFDSTASNSSRSWLLLATALPLLRRRNHSSRRTRV